MRSLIYRFVFAAACILSLSQAQAQKKQTIYYPNGKIAFEGRFQLAWNQTERFEAPETVPDLNQNLVFEERESMLNVYKDLIPGRIYEGKCRYYYPDGKLFATGAYKSGYKNGTFKFYYPNGQLGAKQSYEWGMANGLWESWNEQGRLTRSFHYKTIPESMLQSINEKSLLSRSKEPAMAVKLFFGREYEDFFDNSKQEFRDHWGNLAIFKEYVTKRLYHKAIKEGTFKVWQQGKPYLDMHFSNNIPVGTWTIYDQDQPAFTIVFEAGKIIKATDFLNPENNFGSPENLARKKEPARSIAADDVNAVDPGIVQQEEIFRTVQQMPEAGYDFNKYIRDNLKTPKSKDAAGGRVVVEFVVRKDGRIDKVRAIRSDKTDPALVAAVVKLIQNVPKWQPGRQNGRAVDVYYTFPVDVTVR